MKSHNKQLACILLFMIVLLLNNAVVVVLGAAATTTNGTTAIDDDPQAVDDDPLLGNDCKAGPCNRTPYIRHLWYAHATLMSVSFMILIPSAIIASLIKNTLPGADKKIGYKLHLILNGTALVLIVCGFSIAVYIKQVTRSLPHFTMTCDHRAIGLAIFLLLVVHSTLGYFRPVVVASDSSATGNLKEGKTEDESEQYGGDLALESGKQSHPLQTMSTLSSDNSSSSSSSSRNNNNSRNLHLDFSLVRFVWETCHRFFGLVILMLGWYNCVDGFSEYKTDYDGEVLLVHGPTVYLALQGIIGAIILFLLSAKASKMKAF